MSAYRLTYAILFILVLTPGYLIAQRKGAAELRVIERQFKTALHVAGKMRSRSGKDVVAPRSVRNDTLFMVPSRDWTSGFFAGNLWQTFDLTGNALWKRKAIEYTVLLEKEKMNGKTHDMGFKMYCSYGQAWRLTGETRYRDVLIESARTLMTRFNPAVGCIRSWDHNREKWTFPVIIDNMMNLELLFWTFRQTGDSAFFNVAVRHADTTMKNHFRKDFSSWHVVDYDTLSGSVHVRQTHQGLSDSSSWARGQAWALYGYTMCYRETGLTRYLDHAERIAHYIFHHPAMPPDLVPYWDYDAAKELNSPRDVSAAAITSSALLELSGFNTEQSRQYREWAHTIVRTLAGNYENTRYRNLGFLLDHSTGHLPAHHEIDVPIVYADYYFLEALRRMRSE